MIKKVFLLKMSYMKNDVETNLLYALTLLCDKVGYTVVSLDEIKGANSILAKYSSEIIEKTLFVLEQKGFVSVRFSDGNEFCVSVIKNASAFSKRTSFCAINEGNLSSLHFIIALFAASFTGGIFGGVVGCLIAGAF